MKRIFLLSVTFATVALSLYGQKTSAKLVRLQPAQKISLTSETQSVASLSVPEAGHTKNVLLHQSAPRGAMKNIKTTGLRDTKEKNQLVLSVSEANNPVLLRLAAQGGKVVVSTNKDSTPKEEKVSSDWKKMSIIQISLPKEGGEITIEGEVLALDAKNAKLNRVNLEQAHELVLLDLGENNLTQIDLSACKKLTYAYFMNNVIEQATLGNLPLLQELNLSFNKLTQIDMRQLPELRSVSFDTNKNGNRLTAIDLSGNPKLEKLYFKKNKLQSIDLSRQTGLTELSCEGNKLTSLNLSKAPLLEKLYAKDNSLESIDLSACQKLQELNLSANEKLANIDLKACKQLTELYIFECALSQLDLKENKQLQVLSVGGNLSLTELDLTGLSALQSLSTSFCKLNKLTLSGCDALVSAGLDHNELTGVDFSSCSNLILADVSINRISAANALQMVSTLPQRSADEEGALVFQNKEEFPEDPESNEYNDETIAQAKQRHWKMLNGSQILHNETILIPESRGIYPTVARELINIVGTYTNAHLYSATGELINSCTNTSTLSVAHLPNGIYFLQVAYTDGVKAYRFIVRR